MVQTQKRFKPIVLLILDGWGLAPAGPGNAISLAKTLNIDKLWQKYPHTKLAAHGRAVGLPFRQTGNSEAGHMNLGAGRITEQDSLAISHSINQGTFFKNPAFLEAVKHVKKHKSHCHLMGLLTGEQSAHADPDHLLALLTFLRLKKVSKVFLHLFTDGRDAYRFEAIKLVKRLKSSFKNGEIIATIMGRFYAMDRIKKWERTAMAYHAMTLGEGITVADSEEAIMQAYNRGESDEFIMPSIVLYKNKPSGVISDHDSVIFFNLRSDRARQLAKPFVQEDFETRGGFKRKKILKDLYFVALTDFGPDLDSLATAFPSPDLINTLPMVLKNYSQLYLAEKEKYAHVTYFFNGGQENLVAGEHRQLIPSPDVANYDKVPEMSAERIKKEVFKSLRAKKYNFMTVNFANPDMIGHTGNLAAAVKAVEFVDKCLGGIVKEVLRQQGIVLITADHGNVEKMIDLKTGEVMTGHTTNPVPFIIVAERLYKIKRKGGVLGDVAPTILDILDLEKPSEMTGHSLI